MNTLHGGEKEFNARKSCSYVQLLFAAGEYVFDNSWAVMASRLSQRYYVRPRTPSAFLWPVLSGLAISHNALWRCMCKRLVP